MTLGVDTLGGAVRALRSLRGFSQRQLGERAGMHGNSVGTVERGGCDDIQVATVVGLAEALDVTTAVFAERFLGTPASALQALRFDRVAPGGARAMGHALRSARIAREASVIELADASGVHFNYVATLERGGVASPRLNTLARVLEPLADDEEAHRGLFTTTIRVFSGETPPPGDPGRLRTGGRAARLRYIPTSGSVRDARRTSLPR